jgi:hypothetical protein
MVAALEIAVSLAGWLAVYGWALSGPKLGQSGWLRRAAAKTTRPQPRAEQPAAVVALISGLPAADVFKVTLLGLGTRGWFRLSTAGPPAAGPRAVCVIPVEAPVEELAPYESIAVHHLAKRAGTHTQLPADAVADGYDGGEGHFLASFRKTVLEQARERGLTRPTISLRRKLLLCLLALVPALAPLLPAITTHHVFKGAVGICVFYYVALCAIVAGVTSERLTTDGVLTLAALRAAPPPGRVSAAALGRDTAVLAPFTGPGKNRAWSGYGENWHLVTVGDPARRVWPGMTKNAARVLWVVALPGISVLAIASTLTGHSFATGVLASLILDVVVFVTVTAPWLRLPARAEFEGQVLRQWAIEGTADGETPWTCCLAIDDGTSQRAWALTAVNYNPASLAPGTIVRVTVNPRLNKVIAIEPFRSPASAPQLLNPSPDPRAGA